jgi:hypothetical protein
MPPMKPIKPKPPVPGRPKPTPKPSATQKAPIKRTTIKGMKTFSYNALYNEIKPRRDSDLDMAIKQYIDNRKAKDAGKPIPKSGYGVEPHMLAIVRTANLALNKKAKKK